MEEEPVFFWHNKEISGEVADDAEHFGSGVHLHWTPVSLWCRLRDNASATDFKLFLEMNRPLLNCHPVYVTVDHYPVQKTLHLEFHTSTEAKKTIRALCARWKRGYFFR